MFVLGIDPGLSRCGFGAVIGEQGATVAREHGVLSTPPDDPLPRRLAEMSRGLRDLVRRLRPDVVVVERVFFQVNARTAMSVGQASGLALATAFDEGCEVVQYTANEVKQSVTGYGSASKLQVQRMVQVLLKLPEIPRPPDAADALALALCHLALAGWQGRTSAARSAAADSSPPSLTLGNAKIAQSLGGVAIAVSSATPGRSPKQVQTR